MSFEEERLAILQRVSRGELSPQDGQLEIAMLKVRAERAPDGREASAASAEPGLTATGPTWESEPEAPPQTPFARPTGVNAPIALAIALPLVLIGGIVLVSLTVALAVPTWLLVTLWNPIAASQHWATLSFWPTLGVVTLVFAIVSVGRITRQVLTALQAMR